MNRVKFPINREQFTLVTNPNATLEDYGWSEDYVQDLLWCEKHLAIDDELWDPEDFNDLGIMYTEGVGVEQDVNKGIEYYENAIDLDNDLARSNLADIYRKGLFGVAKDSQKAFELYKDCHLPYAYYRVGEAYENGWGVQQDIEKAKLYYKIAYREGHFLAKKKLHTFNFLK